jgi:heavy metal sensor kinase
MLASVRARLTLWHTLVLAVLLGLFAAGAHTFIVRTSRARTDAAVRDALSDLQTELEAERRQQPSTQVAAREVLQELRFRSIAFVVFDSGGRPVAMSVPRQPESARRDPDPPLDVARLGRRLRSRTGGGPRVITLPDREGGYRAAATMVRMPEGPFIAAAAVSVHAEAEVLEEARLAMLVTIPVALLLASVGGWLLARRSLEPMVTMRERAARIGATNLRERLPVTNPADEVGQLAGVINELLARLDHAFTQQRQFMADASHELRTPVAVVQHEASLALSRPGRDAAEYEDSLTILRDAGRRMRLLVDDLFLLANADAGEVPIRRVPLYLDEVIADCARAVRALAQSRDVTLTLDLPDEAPFTGDEALLHRLVANLLDNAIKYSAAGAAVTLRLSTDHQSYRLEVDDTGPGIPADVQPRIFDRFVRADAARSHDDVHASGAGLGLSIARWIAESHGGRLELGRSSASGSVFVLILPVTSG